MRDAKAYLYRAAVNLALNSVKQRQRHVLTDDAERFESLAGTAGTGKGEDLHARVYEAIAQLDPEDSEILILRYVHEYPNGEIAKLLGKSRGSVAVRLFRSRSRLKQIIRASQREKRS
jgi:RNA polymerase sigma factor (sigma-70 family)